MSSSLSPILPSLAAWLLAGAAFHVVVASASRWRRLAVVAALRGLVALLAVAAMLPWDEALRPWARAASVAATAVVVAVALRLLRERRRQNPTQDTPADLVWTWSWLAGVDLAALLPTVLPGPLLFEHPFLVALPTLVAIPAGMAVFSWSLGRALAGAERRVRAALALGLAVLYAGLPLLLPTTLAMTESTPTSLVVGAFFLLPLIAPLATLCLGGLRPPRPTASSQPTPELAFARLEKRVFLALGLAMASLAWACLAHLDRANGELVRVAQLPASWPATPIIADGIQSGGLGPFRVQGTHQTPSACGGFRRQVTMSFLPYCSHCALYDPLLSFSGAVSLGAEVLDPFAIALHRDDASHVFVVSERESLRAPERQPILAFEQHLWPHWRFAPPSSAWFIGLAVLALIAALGLQFSAGRQARQESGRTRAAQLMRWQLRLLLLALALPWILQAHRAVVDAPSPGHEIRFHTVCREGI